MDFISKWNKNITSKELVRAGQIATVTLVILAAAWAPQIESFASLWEYLQVVLGYIAPPVVAAFVVGLFYKRANGNGAFYSFIVGYSLVILLIILKVIGVSNTLVEMHFLHQVPILFVICALSNIVISNLTDPPAPEKVDGLIWTKKLYNEETEELKSKIWYENYRILSVILMVITAIVVIWFW